MKTTKTGIHKSLVDIGPKDLLPYGETKLLVDEYLWHDHELGCIASYTVKERDVNGHFGLFRGVDQLEFFVQACVVSYVFFREAIKSDLSFQEYLANYHPLFLGIDNVQFQHSAKLGDTMIAVGVIKKYKFKQVTCSGRIYKVSSNVNLKSYCSSLSSSDVKNFNLCSDLTSITEIENSVGWMVKKERLKKSIPNSTENGRTSI